MLSQFLETSDEWITTRTGVKSRHVISDERLEDMPLKMKGQDVFKFAVKASSKDISRLLKENGLNAQDVDYILLHQANIRIINTIRDFIGLEDEKFPTNIADHGNSSSACCPILLDECNRKGMFKKGDKIVICAFGAGFVSGAVLLEW